MNYIPVMLHKQIAASMEIPTILGNIMMIPLFKGNPSFNNRNSKFKSHRYFKISRYGKYK